MSRLSYANVMATAAVFLALGGGAYAAITLPKNSVGTRQLKDHSVTPKKVSAKTVELFRGQNGRQGPPGPTAGGYAENTSIVTLSGIPPVLASLGQTRGTQTPTAGLLTVSYPARLIANTAVDVDANSGGAVWCFLQYAPSGGNWVTMSATAPQLEPNPGGAFALPALGTADVGPGTYDVRSRCGSTGTVAQATEAQLTVTATAR